ncbi:MAG: hypothetical protein A6D92_23460 [Symbiobacterium thermophilum]|uniref:DUF192 domain-containing protein n=2 Tax=Symbiobacterium thermophilum TaxID=2734 RepID=A0A1Y2T3C1_SYMTR|nr:MAG: hypothetical protein A6D92_23460 [Symbiobacterium thermophilum]
MIVRNLTRGLALGDRIRRADTFRLRLLGLMFRPGLEPGEGLWLEPCCQVHTHFMRFPLDLLFLDAEGRVLRALASFPPWRISPAVPGARAVLELPAGAMGETRPGDLVRAFP